MLIEQPGIADASGEHLHGPVPADLLDFPHVGALADGSGDEPGPQQVPGKARGIEPAALGAGLNDAGHGVAGPPDRAHAVALPQAADHRALADAGRLEPGGQAGSGGGLAALR